MTMRGVIFAGMLVVLAVTMIGAAAAATTRLNITMMETVDQNVTFAENFYLNEVQDFCTITGVLNVSNPSADTISDINLTFSNTNNMMQNFINFAGRNGSQISGVNPGDTYIIHIQELRGGDYSSYNYSMNCSTVNPPLDIVTNYSNAETGINRKVLAGHNWTVTQVVNNQLDIMKPINTINISIVSQFVTWNGSSERFFLMELLPGGDAVNVHGNVTSNSSWWWQVNGGTLPAATSRNISYVVRAPYSVPTTATYMAIRESLRYTITYLASNLSLDNVIAVGDLDFGLDKQIIRPADNALSKNVTWAVDANISVPANITYNLTRVTLWVTDTLAPNDYVTPFGRLNRTIIPNQAINLTESWSPSPWYFNYTDGSDNVNARPPIVWLRPYFTVLNAYNQIVNSTVTQNGDDIYMKYIYVVNGYWLEINKNITNVDPDTYRIDTLVENIGNAWTPQGLVVTVYDFVPEQFIPYDWSNAPDSNSAVSGGGFNGTAYRWTIPGKLPYNSSLGPRTESYANRTWNVTYFVNGTGDYRVSELYIVGLDPRQVEGAGTHEGITLVSRLGSSSSEVFYLLIVLFLVAINVINFVMTRRISQKLNNHHAGGGKHDDENSRGPI